MEKVVVITGCSTGIGRELAIQMNRMGWTVVATGRRPELLKGLKEAGCLTFRLDVSDPGQIGLVIDDIISRTGHIDMLINNAGNGLISPLMDISPEEMEKQFRTNFFAMAAMVQKVAPVMKDRKSGIIVNTGSVSGIAPTPFAGAYCATKAAVHAWSDSLRMELKPFGIKVITLQPGGIATEFGNNSMESVKSHLKSDSWYQPVEEFIYKRANTSQENPTPLEKYVSRLINIITAPNPPAIVRTGKRSFTLPLMKLCVPVKLLDRMMMKKYGLNQIK